MALVHVLGGASLLIVVAVSTAVRAGIGLDWGERTPQEPEAVESTAAESVESVEEAVAAPTFGPWLDRMRP